ncbi:MAG: hypothetical protein ACOC9P_01575 [bacterium]
MQKRRPSAQGPYDLYRALPADYPLYGLPNARLLPHLASRTGQALENMCWVVRDVWAVLDGRQPHAPAW